MTAVLQQASTETTEKKWDRSASELQGQQVAFQQNLSQSVPQQCSHNEDAAGNSLKFCGLSVAYLGG